MSEGRTKEQINADLAKVNTAINQYSSFYNSLADAYNSYGVAAVNESHDLYDGFMDAYVGNRQEVIDSISEVSTKADEIAKNITSILGGVETYYNALINARAKLQQELNSASN